MEALFQIGKELGELQARVKALETKKCGCRGKGRGAIPPAQLTARQAQIVQVMGETYGELAKAIAAVVTAHMEAHGVTGSFDAISFKVRDLEVVRAAGADTQMRPEGCMCCPDGDFCCSDGKDCCGMWTNRF